MKTKKPKYRIVQEPNGMFNPYIRRNFLWFEWWQPFWYGSSDDVMFFGDRYGYKTVEACEGVIIYHREWSTRSKRKGTVVKEYDS